MTLVETVIALFLAVFLIAAILSSVVFAADTFAQVKALTNATNIVNQQVEALRAMDFATIASTLAAPPNGSAAASPSPALEIAVGSQRFTVTRSSKLVRNKLPATGSTLLPNPDLIETTITVAWRIKQHPRSVSTQTYFSAFGFAAKS
ncbi:MAG: hypothetical protein IPL39_07180 [Opitutaceae bacterium]|nr:hypothetical protein [Opitutaceae bacterium]